MLRWAGQLERKHGAVITWDRVVPQHLLLHHHPLQLQLSFPHHHHHLLQLLLLHQLPLLHQPLLPHQPLCLSSQHQAVPLIAMQVMMNGQCSGSKDGEVLKRSTAARLQEGDVPLSSHHLQGFPHQVFLQQQTQGPMIARLGTIHASAAWRSTGLPTSLTGAAGRKARDAGVTHQCTCRRKKKMMNMLRDLPIFQHVQKRGSNFV